MGVDHGTVMHFEDRGSDSNSIPVTDRLHDLGSAILIP